MYRVMVPSAIVTGEGKGENGKLIYSRNTYAMFDTPIISDDDGVATQGYATMLELVEAIQM